MTYLFDKARRAGPVPDGRYRVVVDQEERISVCDFADLGTARRYADDAASEYADTPTLAIVVDSDFELVHRGTAYYLR